MSDLGPNDYWLLTEADIMKLLRQNDCAYDPGEPDWDLDKHQDEDEGALPVVVFDVLGLDGQGGDEYHQEKDVEQGEDVVDSAEVTRLLENTSVKVRKINWAGIWINVQTNFPLK